MNESNHESKKITWTQILRAVIQADHRGTHRFGHYQLRIPHLKNKHNIFQFSIYYDTRNIPNDNR
ncbi:hypothetical protein NXW05_21710 [Phocaeicola vulgatus]|nr:hypothetical protein [Phocaeicola vulgatus]MCS3018544.1 hypothetical protein [Phocaeicola vulgatus]